MASANWRGTVGVVKPTYESGSLVEFIRLLPEGVGVIPVYAGIKQHTERGYLDALETYHERVAELAAIGRPAELAGIDPAAGRAGHGLHDLEPAAGRDRVIVIAFTKLNSSQLKHAQSASRCSVVRGKLIHLDNSVA